MAIGHGFGLHTKERVAAKENSAATRSRELSLLNYFQVSLLV